MKHVLVIIAVSVLVHTWSYRQKKVSETVDGKLKQTRNKILSILIILILTQVCFGQNNLRDHESFITVRDTLIKKEMAMFNFKGTSMTVNNSISQSTLTEIPLRQCDSKTATLSKGSTFVHLYFKQDNTTLEQESTNSLDSIFLVTHSHYWVRIPKSAFQGLSNIIACSNNQVEKNKVIISPFFKAFQSNDRKRIYIYMIGGLDKERYEVTWVIKDSEFYTRTIDAI